MDSWTGEQVDAMMKGGNSNLNEFLESHSIARSTAIREKYDNDTAQLYKLQLKARVDNQAVPTELPPPKRHDVENRSKYQGFGSSPIPTQPRILVLAAKWAVPVLIGIGALAFARR